MSHWAKPFEVIDEGVDDTVDLEIIEESALAMAQSTIQNAINESRLTRAEIARRMKCNRSFISRMLSGSHNLTVKTMAKTMAVCGFEVRFKRVPLESNWAADTSPPRKDVEPANAGSPMLIQSLSMAEPALATVSRE